MNQQIIIIGGGAAGLMAAVTAARAGAKVTVLERMNEPGKKILTTGGGRCNISTTLEPADYLARFPDKVARFMRPAIYALDVAQIQEFFASIHIPLNSPEPGKLFPVSQKAKDVRDGLVAECRRLGVSIRCGAQCNSLLVDNGCITGVRFTDDRGTYDFDADSVVLCAGGKSMEALGSDGSGFEVAKSCGHKITPPVPALVPLITAEDWPGELAGLSTGDCTVSVEVDGKVAARHSGDILFTHKGVSGPAVLDCSGEVCAALAASKAVALIVGFVAASPVADWRQKHGSSTVLSLLGKILPSRLANTLCRLCGITGNTTAATLQKQQTQMLEKLLTGCRLEIRKSEGFGKSYATRGGVSLKDVDGKTLQSRRVKGLYFAGEVLDIDAPTGGFNLQWAWASGKFAVNNCLQTKSFLHS